MSCHIPIFAITFVGRLQHFNVASTMEPRTLPLDIFLHIIDLLAGGDDKDIKSLQILSQACKSMVPLCRKYLFSSLRLRNELDSERLNSEHVHDLPSKNPDIACYVRRLNFRVYNPTDHELNSRLDILKERSSLQSIELSSPGLDWNNLPESIRSSLLSLIQLPTVTQLDIYSFEGFPATALSGCSNLIYLQLGDLELVPQAPEVNQVISRSKIPTPVSLYMRTRTSGLDALLNSATLHAGGPIVDLSCLQKASFDVNYAFELGRVDELFKVATRLEYFFIKSECPVLSLILKILTKDICSTTSAREVGRGGRLMRTGRSNY